MPPRRKEHSTPIPPSTEHGHRRQRDGRTIGRSASPVDGEEKTTTRRTGQACDRCRIRKIRCDARAGQCGQCKSANAACQSTDRNTGDIQSRGRLRNLEKDVALLREHNERLVSQLKQLNVEPESTPIGFGGLPRADGNGENDGHQTAKLAAFNPKSIGENYLGAAGHDHLSALQGSQMTLFDNKFDLNKYFPRSEDNELFELSEEDCKSYSQGLMQAKIPSFPTYEDVHELTLLFFHGISFFTPIVHRPMFYDIINKKYIEKAQLNVTDLVIFHMVVSITEFQKAVRSRNTDLGESAKERLIWCLTKVPRLIRDDSLLSMQALVLMCMALRNLQRPGPAWSFCDQILTRAIELGLHRSLTAWETAATQQYSSQHAEMRQRVFWSLVVIHVNISGNLGRPMRLRYEDLDIEFPEPTPDTVPAVDGNMEICSWRIAPYGFRLTHIMLQVYSTVCAVRPAQAAQASSASQLSHQLDQFESELPPELTGDLSAAMTEKVAGLYLGLGIQATRLIIYHPRHLKAAEYDLSDHHLNVLMHTSRSILDIAKQLREVMSLDTTVAYNMDFIYAIFVTLFVMVTRASRGALLDLPQVRVDMQQWLAVLVDIGQMLGTGLALRDRIQDIIRKIFDQVETQYPSGRDRSVSGDADAQATISTAVQPEYTTTGHSFHASNRAVAGTPDGISHHLPAYGITQPTYTPGYHLPPSSPVDINLTYGDMPQTSTLLHRNNSATIWEKSYDAMNNADSRPFDPTFLSIDQHAAPNLGPYVYVPPIGRWEGMYDGSEPQHRQSQHSQQQQ